MIGATAAEDGTAGLVPPPPKGTMDRYLRADGIWCPPDGGNADTIDGFHASQTRDSANTCVVRDANGYTQLGYINSDTPDDENPNISQVIVTNGSDDHYRKASLAWLKGLLGGYYMIGNAGGYVRISQGNTIGYLKLMRVTVSKFQNVYFAFTFYRRGGESLRCCLNFNEQTTMLFSFRGYKDVAGHQSYSDPNGASPPASNARLFLAKVSETSGSQSIYDVYAYATPWSPMTLANLYAPHASVLFYINDKIITSSLPSGYIECTYVNTPIN